MCPIISARCYVARYMLSLCMSVCLSVTVWYCMETTGQIELGFRVDASCHLSYTVLKGNAGISKNKCTSFWNFVPNSRKILPRQVDRVVSKTRRWLSLLTALTPFAMSWIDGRSSTPTEHIVLLHVCRP